MTDETPLNSKDIDTETKSTDSDTDVTDENRIESGIAAQTHEADRVEFPGDESLSRLPPGMNNESVDGHDSSRGIRRPSQPGVDDRQNLHTLNSGKVETPVQYDQQPADSGTIDDILPSDLLFYLHETEEPADSPIAAQSLNTYAENTNTDSHSGLLNDNQLKSTVEDVESSLKILSTEDTGYAGKQKRHQRPMQHHATADRSNPLVFLKRGANKSTRPESILPAPLPAPLAIDDESASVSSELLTGIDSVRTTATDHSEPAKSIENVAEDAVRIMSRSIGAAGGETLDAELAREIRVNLTQLLADWQKEETQRQNKLLQDGISTFEKPLT